MRRSEIKWMRRGSWTTSVPLDPYRSRSSEAHRGSILVAWGLLCCLVFVRRPWMLVLLHDYCSKDWYLYTVYSSEWGVAPVGPARLMEPDGGIAEAGPHRERGRRRVAAEADVRRGGPSRRKEDGLHRRRFVWRRGRPKGGDRRWRGGSG